MKIIKRECLSLLIAAALLAGCGSSSTGGSVAHVKASASESKSGSKTSAKPNAIAFSQCMRAHGVPDFPDPSSSGQLLLKQGGGGINPSSPAFQTASNDCRSLSPVANITPAERSKAVAAALKFATCMQQNGVPNFPDPKATGGAIQLGGPGMDPSLPAFQAAQKKCGSLLPGGKGLPTAPAGG